MGQSSGQSSKIDAARLADILNAKPTSHGWQAKCPAHADKVASLSIKQSEDGKVLLHCFAGCKPDAVLAAVGLGFKDLLHPGEAVQPDSEPILTATYDYCEPDGTLRYQVLRYANPKKFKQRRPDGQGGWIKNLDGVEPLPYNLPKVVEAVEKGEIVWIPEGEKDVNTLTKLGLVGTCNNGGASNWSPAINRWFEKADIVILPDNDQPGMDHAKKIIGELHGIAKRIRVLQLPDLPPKGDVSDWALRGGTKQDLLTLLNKQGGSSGATPALRDRLRYYHQNPQQIRGFCTGYTKLDLMFGGFEGGELLSILAFPNTGKSMFVMQMLSSLCSLGVGAVIPTEMTAEQWKIRMIGMLTGYDYKVIRGGKFDLDTVERALDFIDSMPIHWLDRHRPSYSEVERFVDERPDIDWVIVDSLNDIQGLGGEGMFDQTNRAMDMLHGLTKRQKPLFVITTCHVNRASGDTIGVRNALGSSAVERLSSSVLTLLRPGHQARAGNGGDSTVDQRLLIAQIVKSRFSEIGGSAKYMLLNKEGIFGFHPADTVDVRLNGEAPLLTKHMD